MSFIREKKIFCGEKYMEVDITPCFEEKGKSKKRSKKKKESIPSQKNLNDKNAKRKLVQLVETNFKKDDLHVSLTYNDEFLPKTLEDAEREVTNYIRRVRGAMKKAGLEMKYIIITSFSREEFQIEGEDPVRPHHHILINQGLDRDILEGLWEKRVKGQGKKSMGIANTDRLQPDPNTGLVALANYMGRQPTNKRRWKPSQNLERPTSRTNDHKYTRRKLLNLVGNKVDYSFWERQYPGYYIADKDSGYEEVYNELTGWSIYLKLRKKE